MDDALSQALTDLDAAAERAIARTRLNPETVDLLRQHTETFTAWLGVQIALLGETQMNDLLTQQITVMDEFMTRIRTAARGLGEW